MKKRIVILRITYIWGMIADLIEGIRMLFPKLFVESTGQVIQNTPELSYGLMYGVPVMLGWTLLLFWANQKPVERKGILLCLIPVIIGYIVIQTMGVVSGIYVLRNMLLPYVLETALLILSVTGYLLNRNVEAS
jgi:hypothetical protein